VRDVFLADILASPEDDAPRMAFADWLQENGDPERGEFIVIQLDRDRRARTGVRMSDEERAMRDREGELWGENHWKDSWFGEFMRWPCPPNIRVRRGFLDELHYDAQGFASLPFDTLEGHKLSRPIFDVHPLREVEVTGNWDEYAQQISSRIPKRLRFLTLGDGCEMTRSEATALLSHSRHVGWDSTLEELSFEMHNPSALRMLMEKLPKVRIRAGGTLWSAHTPAGNRKILQERQATLSLMPKNIKETT
jgi:uncharacterized protein (TIGR02996 family)